MYSQIKSLYTAPPDGPSGKSHVPAPWLQDPIKSEPIIRAPDEALLGYRNKCEFSIGLDPNNVPIVGFMLGLYRDGITTVCSAQTCLHVSHTMKSIARAMENFVKSTDIPVYDRKTGKGNWRLLVVRVQQSGDAIVVVQLHPQDLSDKAKDDIREGISAQFGDDVRKVCNKLSVYLQFYDGMNNGFFETFPLELLAGDGHAIETLQLFKDTPLETQLQFRISPFSFFQTNTKACERLFSEIGTWVMNTNGPQSDRKKLILDLCCGTGTIGIATSKLNIVEKVVGIELCSSAVDDAIFNASLNNVENVDYICSKVEDALQKCLKNLSTENVEIVAILDPPRSGVHRNVIYALRDCRWINRIIFVSCNPQAAVKNWVE